MIYMSDFVSLRLFNSFKYATYRYVRSGRVWHTAMRTPESTTKLGVILCNPVSDSELV